MIKPDVVVCWPTNCDYPLWRLFIRENRDRFNFVYVVFTEHSSKITYDNFVTEQMVNDNVSLIRSPEVEAEQDWRDVAIKSALAHSQSEWVWFTEQDFYPTEEFWGNVDYYVENDCNVIAVYQEKRMHPCCIFIKREILDSLNPYFGIVPDKLDHFGKLQQELEQRDDVKIGILDSKNYYHYNGLSHNWRLITDGMPPNYKPEEFLRYLGACLDSIIKKHPIFTEIAIRSINAYLPQKEGK